MIRAAERLLRSLNSGTEAKCIHDKQSLGKGRLADPSAKAGVSKAFTVPVAGWLVARNRVPRAVTQETS